MNSRGFKLALQFLTILPVDIELDREQYLAERTGSLSWYPLVGALVGTGTAAVFYLFAQLVGVGPAAALAVVFEWWFTAGLHWDGLSDTVDGLMSRRPRAEKLSIMRDPNAGALGVSALVLLVVLKFSLLQALASSRVAVPLLVIAYASSRWLLALAVAGYPYAREKGLGASFAQNRDGRTRAGTTVVLLALIGLLLLSVYLVAGAVVDLPVLLVRTALMLVVPGLVVVLLARRIVRLLGGLTGDVYGALAEIALVTALLVGAAGL